QTQDRSPPVEAVGDPSAIVGIDPTYSRAMIWLDRLDRAAKRGPADLVEQQLRYLTQSDADMHAMAVASGIDLLERGMVELQLAQGLHGLARFAEAVAAYDVLLRDDARPIPVSQLVYQRALAVANIKLNDEFQLEDHEAAGRLIDVLVSKEATL